MAAKNVVLDYANAAICCGRRCWTLFESHSRVHQGGEYGFHTQLYGGMCLWIICA